MNLTDRLIHVIPFALVIAGASGLVALPLSAQVAPGQPPAVAEDNRHPGLPPGLQVSETRCDTLVLCPEGLIPGLEPWLRHRQSQGYRIHVASPGKNAVHIRRQIRRIASRSDLQHVILVGDTPGLDGRNGSRSVATDYIAARVVSRFGSEPEIASDNGFADLDDDGLPDLTIGRLPVDTPAQLATLVSKIIRYESAPIGPWQRQINLVAGTGGFGDVSDGVIEKASRGMISELIPPEYAVSLTWANWSSAFCPDPREFADTTVERLNEGCLFWVYMGHGHPHRLDYVRTPAGGFPMFSQQDVERVQCRHGFPVALMLACYTGAFDLPNDCLSEQLVLQPGGPVAAVCSSRVSMPYGMSALSLGLIEEYFAGDRQTLGEMLLVAKRKLGQSQADSAAAEEPEPRPSAMALSSEQSFDEADSTRETPHQKYRRTIQVLGEVFSPRGIVLSEEAREHVHLFHLLGDPLLRMKRPETIELTVQQLESDPRRLVVHGQVPRSGQLLVELGYARDRYRSRPPRRQEFRRDARSLADYTRVYQQANERTVTRKLIEVQAGAFRTELELPEWARGRCVVRGFMAAGAERYALGSSRIHIQRR